MAIKKKQTIAPKKSDAKKKTEDPNPEKKSDNPKQTIKKKYNEFGDNDSF